MIIVVAGVPIEAKGTVVVDREWLAADDEGVKGHWRDGTAVRVSEKGDGRRRVKSRSTRKSGIYAAQIHDGDSPHSLSNFIYPSTQSFVTPMHEFVRPRTTHCCWSQQRRGRATLCISCSVGE